MEGGAAVCSLKNGSLAIFGVHVFTLDILVSTRKRTTLGNAPPLKSGKSGAKSKCLLSTKFV